MTCSQDRFEVFCEIQECIHILSEHCPSMKRSILSDGGNCVYKSANYLSNYRYHTHNLHIGGKNGSTGNTLLFVIKHVSVKIIKTS